MWLLCMMWHNSEIGDGVTGSGKRGKMLALCDCKTLILSCLISLPCFGLLCVFKPAITTEKTPLNG